jgi:undecaprenyl diphosphate synthase
MRIIMDGNGRWAKEKGEDRLFGHFHGVESVRNIVEGCAELGIEYLTYMLLVLKTGKARI